MCYRFSLFATIEKIRKRLSIFQTEIPYKPSFNISPWKDILAVFKEGWNKLARFRWWLVPHWAKDDKIWYKLMNARAESIDQKPSFKKSFKNKRCLIPANGFFEWKKIEWKSYPYYFFLKNIDIFCFAWVYDDWETSEWDTLKSCSIITTEPNSIVWDIHNRMPVIIPKENEQNWLANEDTSFLKDLLKPYDSNEIDVYKVSQHVNSVKADDKECIVRI